MRMQVQSSNKSRSDRSQEGGADMRTSQDGNSSMPGFNVDLDKANRGGSLEVSPVLNKVNEDGRSYIDERTEESKRGCNSEVNVKRNVSQEIKVMAGPFETSDETKLRGGDPGITMGTWQDAKAEDIENYLLGTQRRFIKYKLNIFYLNKCVLRIQHFFHKMKKERMAREAANQQMLQQKLPMSRNTASSHEVVYNRSHQLSTIASANVTYQQVEQTDDQIVIDHLQDASAREVLAADQHTFMPSNSEVVLNQQQKLETTTTDQAKMSKIMAATASAMVSQNNSQKGSRQTSNTREDLSATRNFNKFEERVHLRRGSDKQSSWQTTSVLKQSMSNQNSARRGSPGYQNHLASRTMRNTTMSSTVKTSEIMIGSSGKQKTIATTTTSSRILAPTAASKAREDEINEQQQAKKNSMSPVKKTFNTTDNKLSSVSAQKASSETKTEPQTLKPPAQVSSTVQIVESPARSSRSRASRGSGLQTNEAIEITARQPKPTEFAIKPIQSTRMDTPKDETSMQTIRQVSATIDTPQDENNMESFRQGYHHVQQNSDSYHNGQQNAYSSSSMTTSSRVMAPTAASKSREAAISEQTTWIQNQQAQKDSPHKVESIHKQQSSVSNQSDQFSNNIKKQESEEVRVIDKEVTTITTATIATSSRLLAPTAASKSRAAEVSDSKVFVQGSNQRRGSPKNFIAQNRQSCGSPKNYGHGQQNRLSTQAMQNGYKSAIERDMNSSNTVTAAPRSSSTLMSATAASKSRVAENSATTPQRTLGNRPSWGSNQPNAAQKSKSIERTAGQRMSVGKTVTTTTTTTLATRRTPGETQQQATPGNQTSALQRTIIMETSKDHLSTSPAFASDTDGTSQGVLHSARFGSSKVHAFQQPDMHQTYPATVTFEQQEKPTTAPSPFNHNNEVAGSHTEIKKSLMIKNARPMPSGIPNVMETKRSAYEDGVMNVDTGRTSSSNREEYISMAKTTAAAANGASSASKNDVGVQEQDYQQIASKPHDYQVVHQHKVTESMGSGSVGNNIVNIETTETEQRRRQHQITVPVMDSAQTTRNQVLLDNESATMERVQEEDRITNKKGHQNSRKLEQMPLQQQKKDVFRGAHIVTQTKKKSTSVHRTSGINMSKSHKNLETMQNQQTVEAYADSESAMKSSTRNQKLVAALSKTLDKQQQVRSSSAISNRSTYSAEQKKVNAGKNHMTASQVAAMSMARYQQQHQDYGNKPVATTPITSDKKIEWKQLAPENKKKTLTFEEREQQQIRIQNSMKSLMQPTASSRLKKREEQEGVDGIGQASNEANQTLMTQRKKSTSPFGYATIPEFKGSSTVRAQNKSQQRYPLRSRQGTAKEKTEKTMTFSTSTRSFVNGKEQAKVSRTTMKSSRSQLSRTVTSPNDIGDKSRIIETTMTVDNTSPVRNRMRTSTATSINQQGKLQTSSRNSKSKPAFTVYKTSKNEEDMSSASQRTNPKHEVSLRDSQTVKSIKQSVQAGGNDLLSANDKVEEEQEVLVEEISDVIQERDSLRQSLQSSAKRSKKHSNSMHQSQSQLSISKRSSANQETICKETTSRIIKKTTKKTINEQRQSKELTETKTVRKQQEKKQSVIQDESPLKSRSSFQTEPKQSTVKKNQAAHNIKAEDMINIANLDSPEPEMRQQQFVYTSVNAQTIADRLANEEQQKIHSEQQFKSKYQVDNAFMAPETEIYVEQEVEVSQHQQQPDKMHLLEHHQHHKIQQEPTEHMQSYEDEKEAVFFDAGDKEYRHQTNQVFTKRSSERYQETEDLSDLHKTSVNQPIQQQEYAQNEQIIVQNNKKVMDKKEVAAFPTTFRSEPCVLETQFKEDTKAHLQKCLNEDLNLSKIQKSYRREFNEIKEILQKYFYKLNAIFLFYCGQSPTYPTLDIQDFFNFASECGILSENLLNQNDIQKLWAETILSTNNLKKSGETGLFRYEFIEIIIRIAAFIAKTRSQAGQTENTSISETLQILLDDIIDPNSQRVNRYKFRKMLIQDARVSELLNRNYNVFDSAFQYFTHARKKTVNLEEIKALATQCQLDVPEAMLGVVFAESLMTVIDTVRNKDRMSQLSFPEFVYFLCRITDVHFTNTQYEDEEFYVKFDNLLPELLDPIDLKPAFRYGVQFTCDQEPVQNQRIVIESTEESQIHENTPLINTQDNSMDAQQKNEAQQDITGEGCEIEAWQQPIPIAYPNRQAVRSKESQLAEQQYQQQLLQMQHEKEMQQRQQMIKEQEVQSRMQVPESNPEEITVHVVERRQRRKTTAALAGEQSTKTTRTYLSSSKQRR